MDIVGPLPKKLLSSYSLVLRALEQSYLLVEAIGDAVKLIDRGVMLLGLYPRDSLLSPSASRIFGDRSIVNSGL